MKFMSIVARIMNLLLKQNCYEIPLPMLIALNKISLSLQIKKPPQEL